MGRDGIGCGGAVIEAASGDNTGRPGWLSRGGALGVWDGSGATVGGVPRDVISGGATG
jgi:hypothetical protein